MTAVRPRLAVAPALPVAIALAVAALALVLGMPATRAAAADPSFAGSWDTTFGRLDLTQEGTAVRGTYYGGSATVTGTVDDKGRLAFRYVERTVKGEGWFELAADGASFKGEWRPEDEQGWRSWTGKRAARAPAAAAGFAGLFETSFGRMRLEVDGKKVRGTYAHGGGSTIEGTLEDDGKRLAFKYREPGAAGTGTFTLADAAGSAFSGTWRADGDRTDGRWTGTRIRPQAGIHWLVVLETPWEESLAEEEYAFGEILRTFFARLPDVRVRHRRLYDAADYARAAAEIAYLAEPVAVVIAGHGSEEGLEIPGGSLGAKAVAAGLAAAPNVMLLHFSSCDVLAGRFADDLFAALPAGRKLALSGYAVSVDWAASALIELLYLDLVLGRGIAPARAAELVRAELACSKGQGVPGSPLGAARFVFVERGADGAAAPATPRSRAEDR